MTLGPKRMLPLRLLATVAVLTALSGCLLNPDSMPPNETRSVDQLYHSLMRLQPAVVRPQIETVTSVHKVDFAFGADELSNGEVDNLTKFLVEGGADHGSRVAIDGPRKAAGHFDILTKARIATIGDRLAGMGIDAEVARKPIESLTRPEGAIVVTITRAMVIEPDCAVPKTIYGPRPTHIWSCSSAVALGRMVADPLDLERGRTLGPADGEMQARGIERYRTDKLKPFTTESTEGGS